MLLTEQNMLIFQFVVLIFFFLQYLHFYVFTRFFLHYLQYLHGVGLSTFIFFFSCRLSCCLRRRCP